MKKVLVTLFFGFVLYNTAFAESYYFKECQLSEIRSGDYLIDLDNNVIRTSLRLTNGTALEKSSSILSVYLKI